MAHLEIQLLGPFNVTLDNQPVAFSYDKVRALLAYLCVEHNQPVPRVRLTGLLWPDQSQTAAQDSLRQAISRLRSDIHDRDAQPPVITIDRDHLQLNLESRVTIDLVTFRSHLSWTASHHHRSLPACTTCTGMLEEASNLVRGSFLEDLSLPDSDIFENWATLLREQVKIQALEIRGVLAAHYALHSDFKSVLKYARQQLLIDAYHEPAHRYIMRALTHSGQRSQAVLHFTHLKQLLEDDLGISPAVETLALYDLIKEGNLQIEPSGAQTNLPASLGPIVGREVELSELVVWLADPDRRLISVVGPGGTGKTLLVSEAVQKAAAMFAHGAVYVSLSMAGAGGSLVEAIAESLSQSGYVLSFDWPQVSAYFREREMLLVLDGFENLLDERARVSQLLETANDLVVLITTRERLNLPGEWIFDLGGLDVPPTSMTGRLEAYSSVTLFCGCARQVNRAFELNDSNRVAIGEICRLVGGNPLAIRLAAGWTYSLPCHEIASEIRRSLDFLSIAGRAGERHSSVRAVFEQSWKLLDDAEKADFSRLTVFAGSFDHSAAESITGTKVDTLARLVDKSLLHVTPEGRYDFHDLLYQFAAEKLAETGTLTDLRRRHFEWYFTEAEQNERMLGSKGTLNAFIWLIHEAANLRAAFSWAQVHSPQKASRLARWMHADFHQSGVHVFARQEGKT